MSEAIVMFWWMMVGHALADFPLQPRDMTVGKNRHRVPDNIPPGQTLATVWPYWMTAHALTHGGAVALATGSVALGMAETVIHWMTDFAKCENWTTVHQDQAIHMICKVGWMLLAIGWH
ncbi:hypothetical protein LCGC14_0451230 [marine sediment metagenome]|uniref:DUF3307 domain-containing protein n=1 Tax=marine sediment metagenome TaxID=412755 RepID=A0A0F9T124_9ZZZZ